MAGQCAQSRCGQPSQTDCVSLLLQTLFKVSPAAAVDILKVAKSVLEHWYATYMQVREKIEISGRDARWEFSKQMLFERTNFMVSACGFTQDPLRLVSNMRVCCWALSLWKASWQFDCRCSCLMPVQVDVCSDLTDMVEVIDDFHKFLGPELKAVTGDTQVLAPHKHLLQWNLIDLRHALGCWRVCYALMLFWDAAGH